MTTWVALLRGVNVGGITIRNADLAEVFAALGFERVRTVLASGNVVFEAGGAASGRVKLKTAIEGALRTRFGYDAWIVLVTLGELATAADGFPFDDTDASRQPWVIFCVDDATRDELVTAAAQLDASADPVAPGRPWMRQSDAGDSEPQNADNNPVTDADQPAPALWLAYPDTDLKLAEVRARLILVSLLEGSLDRAAALVPV